MLTIFARLAVEIRFTKLAVLVRSARLAVETNLARFAVETKLAKLAVLATDPQGIVERYPIVPRPITVEAS